MRSIRNGEILPNPKPGDAPEVRRHGRLRCHLLECLLGEVQDISASGLRVRSRGKPVVKVGECMILTLQSVSTRLELPVEVVWVKKVGFRRYDVGLRFGDLPRAAREALTIMARAAAKRETMRPEGAI